MDTRGCQGENLARNSLLSQGRGSKASGGEWASGERGGAGALVNIVGAAPLRLGLVFDLGGDAADLLHRRNWPVDVCHHADGDGDERIDLRLALAIPGDQRAARHIVSIVEREALRIPARDEGAADAIHPVGAGYDHKIIAADMAHEVAQVALVAHAFSGDAAEQLDDIVAADGAVDVVVRLEVIQVNVEDGPVGGGFELLLDGALHTQAGGEAGQRGEQRLAHVAELIADARQQLVAVERLGEVVVDLRLEGAHLVGGVVARAEHHDGDVRGLGVRAQVLDHLEAVHPWEHDVEDEQLRHLAQGIVDALLAGRRDHRGEPLSLKGVPQEAANARIVLDHKDGWRGRVGGNRVHGDPPVCPPAGRPAAATRPDGYLSLYPPPRGRVHPRRRRSWCGRTIVTRHAARALRAYRSAGRR